MHLARQSASFVQSWLGTGWWSLAPFPVLCDWSVRARLMSEMGVWSQSALQWKYFFVLFTGRRWISRLCCNHESGEWVSGKAGKRGNEYFFAGFVRMSPVWFPTAKKEIFLGSSFCLLSYYLWYSALLFFVVLPFDVGLWLFFPNVWWVGSSLSPSPRFQKKPLLFFHWEEVFLLFASCLDFIKLLFCHFNNWELLKETFWF